LWDANQNGWALSAFPDGVTSPFVKGISESAVRICSYFALEETA
jgi:hypothetical protein